MGLTSALNTSLNGLSLNETTIDVIGNNIANAGTTAFKASRVSFQTQLARTLSFGSRPTETNGGTNPREIGLGALTAEVKPDFSQGSITATTSASDLALQGDGFFVLRSGDTIRYTRDGSFRLDSSNLLSTSQGDRLLGYGVDQNFQIQQTQGQGQLVPLSIPVGQLTVAQPTRNGQLGGALSTQGAIGTQGTTQISGILRSGSGTGPLITGATLLTNTFANGGASPLFTSGTSISLSPALGGRALNPKTLPVTSTTTINDLMQFVNNTMGLQSGGGVPVDADGIPVGVALSSPADGTITVKGNRGTVNDFDLSTAFTNTAGQFIQLGFQTPPGLAANGQSASTTFTTFDSLGQPVVVRAAAVLENKVASGGSAWRFILTSQDNQTLVGLTQSAALRNFTLSFDGQARVITDGSQDTNPSIGIDRTGTGANAGMTFNLDLTRLSGTSNTGSNINLTNQDGSSPGTLVSYVIDEAGIINGTFDNGIVRQLGQIVLTRFANPAGLLQAGNNTFRQGISSGEPQQVTPGSFGAASIRSGALELSNTDIGKNLVDLIVASTNYRGNARVISSVDALTNELLQLARV